MTYYVTWVCPKSNAVAGIHYRDSVRANAIADRAIRVGYVNVSIAREDSPVCGL